MFSVIFGILGLGYFIWTGANDIINLCLPLISGALLDILIQLTKRNEKQ